MQEDPSTFLNAAVSPFQKGGTAVSGRTHWLGAIRDTPVRRRSSENYYEFYVQVKSVLPFITNMR